MARSNPPGDPFEQRQRALAEEERRLAEEAARLRREVEENSHQAASEARTARIREENPGLAAHTDGEHAAPLLRHSAARRRDRARFFVLLFALGLVVLWLMRLLG